AVQSVCGGDTIQFLQGCLPQDHLLPTVHAQASHPVADGDALQAGGGFVADDELAELRVDLEDLVDGGTAAIAGVRAALATDREVHVDAFLDLLFRGAESRWVVQNRVLLALALRTERAQQALR